MPALAALGLDARRLALFAARAGAASEAIDAAAREAGDRLVHPARDGALSIDRAGFALLPSAVGVELLSQALLTVGGAGKSRDRAPVEALHAALAASDPV